jgi:PDZ domain-containing protein
MQGFILVSSHDEESLETPDGLGMGSAALGGADNPARGQPVPAGSRSDEDGPDGRHGTEGDGFGDAPTTAGTPPGRGRRRPVKRWHILGGIGGLVIVAVLVASLITIPYYALTPGQAQSVGPLIDISPSAVHSHRGSVLLVDVEETEMRAIDWIYFKLDHNATIIKSSEILGPETPAQNNTEGVLDMSDAQQAATVVALNELGYHVKVTPAGALLYALLPGSPAEADLAVGDKVTAVGSRPVTSAQSLSTALAPDKPGATVELTLTTLAPRTVKRVRVTLGTWRIVGPRKSASLDCFPSGEGGRYEIAARYPDGALGYPTKGKAVQPVACLGVLQVEDAYSIGRLPFSINLRSEGIVGPSAGLAFTLGLMEKLDPEDLTGGHKVAATGTMAINGAVGEIGGIKQKTIAVRSSGATLFLVPPGNYSTARAYAGSSLHVVAVSSISQAITALEHYGGKLRKVA